MATISQSELLKRTLATMEEGLQIPTKNAKDFVDSLKAVVGEVIEAGDAVSIFGLVKLTPKGVTAKPKRKGVDPRTGEEKDYPAKPASLRLGANAQKAAKSALPGATTKAGKALIAVAKDRAQAATERREAREAEATKPPKKTSKKKG